MCPPGLERDLYVSALSEAGFSTTAVGTAAAAVKSLERAETPDAIVVDLFPEPSDAWALIERSVAHPSGIPVMVLTSLIRPDGSNRQKARALGCAAFVAKPCSLRQLVGVLRRVQSGERGLEVVTYSESGS